MTQLIRHQSPCKVDLIDVSMGPAKEDNEVDAELRSSTFAMFWRNAVEIHRNTKFDDDENEIQMQKIAAHSTNITIPSIMINYILAYYLPGCVLWSKRVLCDVVDTFDANVFGHDVQSRNDVTNTNVFAEELFRIKNETTILNHNRLPLQ